MSIMLSSPMFRHLHNAIQQKSLTQYSSSSPMVSFKGSSYDAHETSEHLAKNSVKHAKPDLSTPFENGNVENRSMFTRFLRNGEVSFGKLIWFLSRHPRYKTLEVVAASTAQVPLTLSVGLLSAFNDKASDYKIIATDKYYPNALKIGQQGIVWAVGANSEYADIEDSFDRLAAEWDTARRHSHGTIKDGLSAFIDRQPLNHLEPYKNWHPKKTINNRGVSIEQAFQKLSPEEKPDFLTKAIMESSLFSVRDKWKPHIRQMIHAETEKSYDLIDVIRNNPFIQDKSKPRLIFIQNVVYQLSSEEQEKLLQALPTLPKHSMIILGSNEKHTADLKPFREGLSKLEKQGFIKYPEIPGAYQKVSKPALYFNQFKRWFFRGSQT